MRTNELSPEKSIQIISEMVEKSRKDFEKDSGTPLIVWGTVVTLVSVMVWYVLKVTAEPYWNLLWFSIPVIGYPASYFMCRKKQEKRAKNFINSTIGAIWGCFGVVATLLPLIACTLYHEALVYLSSWITIVLGFSSALSGLLLKNYWIAMGGFVVAVAGSMASIAMEEVDLPLLMGGAAIITLLIPGIILNGKRK